MKLIRHISIFCITCLIVGLSSCSIINQIQYEAVSIQVLSAPDSMSLHKGKYLVVNRVQASLHNLNIDTVKAGELKLNKDFYKSLSWQLINSCLDVIELSPLMDSIILDTMPRKELSSSSLSLVDPLPADVIEDLCMVNGANGIISLECMNIFDSLQLSPLYDTRMGDSIIWGYYAKEHIFPGVKWKVYAENGEIIYQFATKDTLMMDGVGTSKNEAIAKLYKEDEILYEAMRREGKTFGDNIAPSWLTVSRIYYSSGNKEMKNAAKLASNENWYGAAEIWRVQVETSDDETIKAKASFNMALASEIMDQIHLALYWVNKSYNFEKDDITLQYVKILRSRAVMRNRMKESLFDSTGP